MKEALVEITLEQSTIFTWMLIAEITDEFIVDLGHHAPLLGTMKYHCGAPVVLFCSC
jgi:hypothetical protein